MFRCSLKNQYVVTSTDTISNISQQTQYFNDMFHFGLPGTCLQKSPENTPFWRRLRIGAPRLGGRFYQPSQRASRNLDFQIWRFSLNTPKSKKSDRLPPYWPPMGFLMTLCAASELAAPGDAVFLLWLHVVRAHSDNKVDPIGSPRPGDSEFHINRYMHHTDD